MQAVIICFNCLSNIGVILALSFGWISMPRTNACRTTGWMYLSVTLGILPAANAMAHPMAADAGTLSAEAPDSEPGDLTALLNAASGLPHQYQRAWNVHSGRRDLPSDPLTSVGDGRSSASWLGQAQLPVDRDPGLLGEADPLSATLHPMRNRNPARSLSPPPPPQAQAQADPTTNVQREEDLITAIRELQRSGIETLAGALDASRDIDGQIAFSLGGIEGFRYMAKGGEVSLGYGETAMTVTQQSVNAASAPPGHGPPPRSARHEEKSTSEFIQFFQEILQYPLVWLTLLFLAIAKVAWLVSSRRGKKRIRRRRSRTDHHVQQARVKRKRVRVRFRIKRAPTAAEPQEL